MEPPERTRVALAAIVDFTRHLQAHGFVDGGLDAAGLVQRIGALETLKAVVSATQAAYTAAFAAAREAELASLPTRDGDRQAAARRDIGAQVGLARRVNPRIGSRLVGLAKVLTLEMPATMGALRDGRIDEYQAMLVVAETAALSLEHRQRVDAELAARFGTMTPAQAKGAAARIGYRLDPEQAVRRARKAAGDRCVTLRPAPDTMTYLTALLPVADGVAAYAALARHATTAAAIGDPRGRGALMADALVARLVAPVVDGASAGERQAPPFGLGATGGDFDLDGELDPAAYLTDGLPGLPAGVHLEIQLVMTDRTLFDGDAEPAILNGHGPIPAPLARRLVRSADPATRTWVRRLYTDDTGRLTDADSRRRLFPHAVRQFLVSRDQVCRTPWCAAPIRHADHTRSHSAGGPTRLSNGAGRCASCNQIKEQPGWDTATDADGGIVTVTPTGHRYRSQPPPAPRSGQWEQHSARTSRTA